MMLYLFLSGFLDSGKPLKVYFNQGIAVPCFNKKQMISLKFLKINDWKLKHMLKLVNIKLFSLFIVCSLNSKHSIAKTGGGGEGKFPVKENNFFIKMNIFIQTPDCRCTLF